MLIKDRDGRDKKNDRACQQMGLPVEAGGKHKGHGRRDQADIARGESDHNCRGEQDQKPFPAPGKHHAAHARKPLAALEAEENRVQMPDDAGGPRQRPGGYQIGKQQLADLPGSEGFQNVQQGRHEKGVLSDEKEHVCRADIPGPLFPDIVALCLSEEERRTDISKQITDKDTG